MSNPEHNEAAETEEGENMLFVATRLGQMLNVTQNNSRYFFDFAVCGYPNNNHDPLSAIWLALVDNGEVPPRKWVVASTLTSNLDALKGGSDDTNWSAIVDILSRRPMQFVNDAFWRLRGPFSGRRGKLRQPRLEYDRLGDQVRKVSSYYSIVEHSTLKIELI